MQYFFICYQSCDRISDLKCCCRKARWLTCIKARSNILDISTHNIAALVCTTCFLRLATLSQRVARYWMKPNVWNLFCAAMLIFEIRAQVSIPITSSIQNLVRNFFIRQMDNILLQFTTIYNYLCAQWLNDFSFFLFSFCFYFLGCLVFLEEFLLWDYGRSCQKPQRYINPGLFYIQLLAD